MSYRNLDDKNDRMKPIDKLGDVATYMENPPEWGKYAKPLAERSEVVKNCDIIRGDSSGFFCHANPDNLEAVPPRYKSSAVPKTLICHDMKNGYLDDSYLHGTEDYTAYHFYHWSAIDIFCYFSHHLVTIPPLGWINAAHDHGVKIIGTIITEWREGFSICEEILASEDSYKRFAHRITAIAKYHRLDGWLLNIENQIKKPERLVNFVSYLKEKLHEEIPGSVLIWYDSVTVKGTLEWQNKLNCQNMDFFKASDGIFLNYSWYEEDLKISRQNAGDRQYDVYVGMDVWGRNFWGGGQFNLDQALEKAKKYDLSLAIFAFAWTHEAIVTKELVNDYMAQFKDKVESPSMAMPEAVHSIIEKRRRSSTPPHYVANSEMFLKNVFFKEFLLRDKAFWTLCWPVLHTHGPKTLPFQTSFCRGQGEKKRLSGKVVSERSWFDLTQAQYQLSFPHCGVCHELQLVNKVHPEKDKKDEEKLDEINKNENTVDLITTENVDKTKSTANSDSNVNMKSGRLSITEDVDKSKINILKREASQSPRRSVEDDPTSGCLEKVAILLGINSNKRAKGNTQNDSILVKTDDFEPKSYEDNAKIQSNLTQDVDELGTKEDQYANYDSSDVDNDIRLALNALDRATREAENETKKSELSNVNADSHIFPENKEQNSQVTIQKNKKAPVVRKKAISLSTVNPCLEVYYDDSFNGGSCIKILPTEQTSSSQRPCHPHRRTINRLFICEFDCHDSLIIYCITKTLPGNDEQTLNIVLKLRSIHTGKFNTIVLSGKDLDKDATRSCEKYQADDVIYPISGMHFKEIQTYLLLNHRDIYVPIDNDYGWNVRYYLVEYPETSLIEIQSELGNISAGPILLGSLGICAGPVSTTKK